jgi:hypothetical protein
MTREDAQKALEAALSGQREARADVMVAQARALEWDAQVLIARAQLTRLGATPELIASGGRQVSHAELRESVLSVLRGAEKPLTIDEVIAGLNAEGVGLPGDKPRQTLMAYLSRWPEVSRVRKGLYISPQSSRDQLQGEA